MDIKEKLQNEDIECLKKNIEKNNEVIKQQLNKLNSLTKIALEPINSISVNLQTVFLKQINEMVISRNKKINEAMINLSKTLSSDVLKEIYDSCSINKMFSDLIKASNLNYTNILPQNMKNISKFYQDSFSNLIQPTLECLKVMTDTKITEIDNVFKNIIKKNKNFIDFDINNYDENVIEEAQNLVFDTFQENIEEDLNWQQKLTQKSKEYSKKNPVYAWFLEKFISYMLTIMFASLIYGGVVNKVKTIFLNNNETKYEINNAKKETERVLNSDYYYIKQDILRQIRYIDKSNVAIRRGHFMKSEILIRVDCGEVVEIVFNDNNMKKRYKNWIYVDYTDAEGNLYRGWINNMYTKRIK